ncbi:MAG TPA: M20/M25/M40 family metallo-hydrolase, partial [Myxococcales bacterium]|nr:M20/M25/M40 family metallo-hydrolase [Myxococcales bacterium]
EESGGAGIQWQLAHAPETLDAEIALNEGGGPVFGDDGRVKLVDLETAEKTYQDVTLRTTGRTGHASAPLGDNAIVRLAHALERVAAHPFPPHLLPVTRAYFAGLAKIEKGELGHAMRQLADSAGPPPPDALAVVDRDPSLAALLRTTCEPTLLSAGTRVNALPGTAEANLNCRILPDQTPADVRAALVAAIADPKVEVELGPDAGRSGPSPLTGAAPGAIRAVAAKLWPGAPVIPSLCAGADDSRFLRPRGVAAYGLIPFPLTEADDRRAHGIDERIPDDSISVGLRFFRRLVLDLAAK